MEAFLDKERCGERLFKFASQSSDTECIQMQASERGRCINSSAAAAAAAAADSGHASCEK
jgi:hypothetical protein